MMKKGQKTDSTEHASLCLDESVPRNAEGRQKDLKESEDRTSQSLFKRFEDSGIHNSFEVANSLSETSSIMGQMERFYEGLEDTVLMKKLNTCEDQLTRVVRSLEDITGVVRNLAQSQENLAIEQEKLQRNQSELDMEQVWRNTRRFSEPLCSKNQDLKNSDSEREISSDSNTPSIPDQELQKMDQENTHSHDDSDSMNNSEFTDPCKDKWTSLDDLNLFTHVRTSPWKSCKILRGKSWQVLITLPTTTL